MTNTTRYNKKLRAYLRFIVKQKRHQEIYVVNRIRAVLTEAIETNRPNAYGAQLTKRV
jgi:hypothetical protein